MSLWYHLLWVSECFLTINEGDQTQLHEGCTFGKETSSQTKRGDQTRNTSLSRDIREEPLWWCNEGPSALQVSTYQGIALEQATRERILFWCPLQSQKIIHARHHLWCTKEEIQDIWWRPEEARHCHHWRLVSRADEASLPLKYVINTDRFRETWDWHILDEGESETRERIKVKSIVHSL